MYSTFEKVTLCIAWLFVLIPMLFLLTHWTRNRKPEAEPESPESTEKKGGSDE